LSFAGRLSIWEFKETRETCQIKREVQVEKLMVIRELLKLSGETNKYVNLIKISESAKNLEFNERVLFSRITKILIIFNSRRPFLCKFFQKLHSNIFLKIN
jgi:hypothetical protein